MSTSHISRKYTSMELVRFARLALANPEANPVALLKPFSEAYPELSDHEKLKNLIKALDNLMEEE